MENSVTPKSKKPRKKKAPAKDDEDSAEKIKRKMEEEYDENI